jgi:hypothetical protein
LGGKLLPASLGTEPISFVFKVIGKFAVPGLQVEIAHWVHFADGLGPGLDKFMGLGGELLPAGLGAEPVGLVFKIISEIAVHGLQVEVANRIHVTPGLGCFGHGKISSSGFVG